MGEPRALRNNFNWAVPPLTRSRNNDDWHYRIPEKVEAVFDIASSFLRMQEADVQARANFPKIDEGDRQAQETAAGEFSESFGSELSGQCVGNMCQLLLGLPSDLLRSDWEFGSTDDGFATITWYSTDGIAALSVGDQPLVYFSTVNKSGHKASGSKAIDNLELVIGAVRDA